MLATVTLKDNGAIFYSIEENFSHVTTDKAISYKRGRSSMFACSVSKVHC